MSIIMGGSGSTGSSLVKNILNRHPDIFAGGETSFFAKKMIYQNWRKSKTRITSRGIMGLRNHGFHIYNGTDLSEQEYLSDQFEIQEMANSSDSLASFCKEYYKKPLSQKGARLWLEKTPANAACFDMFLDQFQDGQVIHMVRDPFDTIASLWARGYSLYYAVGIYLLNTGCGLMASTQGNRYFELKYEDIINSPAETIENVCRFIGIPFFENMLHSQNETIEISQLSSWNYDETANIGRKAVGRFEKLDKEKQTQIIEAVNEIEVSEIGKRYYGTNVTNVKDICSLLGYEFHESKTSKSHNELKKKRISDRLERIKRGYKTGVYYPLSLRR